jgi:hypothetical protein
MIAWLSFKRAGAVAAADDSRQSTKRFPILVDA